MVASLIENVAYAVTRQRPSALALLSPRELQSAAMVRDGVEMSAIRVRPQHGDIRSGAVGNR